MSISNMPVFTSESDWMAFIPPLTDIVRTIKRKIKTRDLTRDHIDAFLVSEDAGVTEELTRHISDETAIIVLAELFLGRTWENIHDTLNIHRPDKNRR